VLRLFFVFIIFFCQQASADDVLVAARNIKKGEIVSQDDFSYDSVKSNKNYLTHVDLSSNNVKAARNIDSGKPIRKTDLYNDSAIIHKGERVVARFVRKNLSIEIPCIALTNGNVNEFVKIKTIDTNKVLTGKASEDGSVMIGNE
jgi:flagella basal body P-ring formation protein FlgA